MKSSMNAFVIGLLLGGGLGWFASQQWQRPSAAKERIREESTRAVDAAGEAFSRTGEAIKAKAEVLGLTPGQIKEELAESGRVVRRQSREMADKAADSTVDAAITTAVKTRLAADEELSVWSIGVKTDAAHVMLDGEVDTEEQIARAVTLALETDGVVRVTAHLKIRKPE